MPRLKVYRTPIGFHDAYVAAPSQKAALAAWGSDKDLFARGVAEVVDDPALMEEPLARPGEVVKRLRGTDAEQIAALPKDKPKAAKTAAPKQGAKTTTARPKPRPSRAALDDAEAALEAAERKHDAARERIAEAERKLAEERRALDAAYREGVATLESARDDAEEAYKAAMSKWRS